MEKHKSTISLFTRIILEFPIIFEVPYIPPKQVRYFIKGKRYVSIPGGGIAWRFKHPWWR